MISASTSARGLGVANWRCASTFNRPSFFMARSSAASFWWRIGLALMAARCAGVIGHHHGQCARPPSSVAPWPMLPAAVGLRQRRLASEPYPRRSSSVQFSALWCLLCVCVPPLSCNLRGLSIGYLGVVGASRGVFPRCFCRSQMCCIYATGRGARSFQVGQPARRLIAKNHNNAL